MSAKKHYPSTPRANRAIQWQKNGIIIKIHRGHKWQH